MKFSTSLIISFLAIIALVAEFVLSLIFGFGSLVFGNKSSMSIIVLLFIYLIVLTIATIFLAPISAIIELSLNKFYDIKKINKKNNTIKWILNDLGNSILFISLSLVFLFLIIISIPGLAN